jgi:RNA recognition motif-containing protein
MRASWSVSPLHIHTIDRLDRPNERGTQLVLFSLQSKPYTSHRVFIRNLPFTATTADLEELCGTVGPVKRASIIQGANGVSRGFGFVKFALPEDAARAASILHRSDFRGRALAVELAMKKGQKPANVPDAPAAKRAKAAAAAAAASAAAVAAAKVPKSATAPAKDETEGTETAAAAAEEKDVGAKQPQQSRPQQQQQSPAAGERKRKPAPALVGQHPSNTLLVFNLAAQTTEKQLYKRVKKIQPPTSVKTQVGLHAYRTTPRK